MTILVYNEILTSIFTSYKTTAVNCANQYSVIMHLDGS